jgi:LacI family transcriptional regulator
MAPEKLRVGVAVDTVTGFGRQIMRGVMKYASLKRRWLLLKEFMVFETDPTAWPRCHGIIAGIADPPILRQFRKVARHVVCCSGSGDPAITPVVCMDDIAVGRLAAAHLLDCQLRHFGYYGTLNNKLSDNRLRGFREALGEHGLTCQQAPLTQAWNRPLRAGWQSHWPRLLEWIRSLPRPVGILAVDDMAADDLAAACFDAGIVIPDQVALIGVNNDDLLCEGAWPPISSVQPDYQRVGMMAAKILDDLISGKPLKPERRHVRLRPVGVVARTSTDVLAVDEPELASAVRYIREHACDPCSVGDVLRQVPVARRWLEKQFVQKLGRTPHDEITHVRMDHAQRSLLDREMTIQQVAQNCGYSTVQSFNRVFRSAVGESPGAFRRARLQRLEA